MNTYILKLVDNFADTRYEERCSYYVVNTEKSLQEVIETYNAAHEEWHDEELNKDFDCLIAHIAMRLEEKGMYMESLSYDAEVEF